MIRYLLTAALVGVFVASPVRASAAPPETPAAARDSIPGRSMPMPEMASPVTETLSSLAGSQAWPDPVADRASYSFLILDNFEYQASDGPGAVRWDVFAWRGGDIHRIWVKSEGRLPSSSTEGGEVEVQALYGRLVTPFFDLQAGARFDERVRAESRPSRFYAVVGLQGLSPYRFEIEPTVFLSQEGQISGRLTATLDLLFSQRLVLQPRLEMNASAQSDAEVGIGAGLNDVEVGLRLRHEIRRELAPYLGVTWKESFGRTHMLTVAGGGDADHFVVVSGLRLWF